MWLKLIFFSNSRFSVDFIVKFWKNPKKPGFFQIPFEKNRKNPAIKTVFFQTGFYYLANPAVGYIFSLLTFKVLIRLFGENANNRCPKTYFLDIILQINEGVRWAKTGQVTIFLHVIVPLCHQWLLEVGPTFQLAVVLCKPSLNEQCRLDEWIAGG